MSFNTLRRYPESNSKASFEDIEKAEREFARVSSKFVRIHLVEMPPTWSIEVPQVFSQVVFDDDLDRDELRTFFTVTRKLNLSNPRMVSAKMLELASILHPALFRNFVESHLVTNRTPEISRFLSKLQALKLRTDSEQPRSALNSIFYLQSMLFLAGCTLSSAVIHGRFSVESIASKLDRLWLAASYAQRFGCSKLKSLQLDRFVSNVSTATNSTNVQKLIAIKHQYGRALGSLSTESDMTMTDLHASVLTSTEKHKFGFLDDLKTGLGSNLRAVFAFGSSVTSSEFNDYDIILLVKSAESALDQLADNPPSYNGKEINISVFDESDFLPFQVSSGDNLDQNVICLFGNATVPIKSREQLLIRNLSFAFIRLRQLLGMVAFVNTSSQCDDFRDRQHLLNYFVKIPMHIMKGVLSVLGEPVGKEILYPWCEAELDYSLKDQLKKLEEGNVTEALTESYFATAATIAHLMSRLNLFEPTPLVELLREGRCNDHNT